ncbi:MAG: hypothetical protein VX278_24140 [Myxococcota bacterium]|nr:hypothetical protein [Myxococcota bacterium]
MKKDWLWLLVPVLFCGFPYLRGGLVWDDAYLLVELLPYQNWFDIWLSPVGGGSVGEGYYRPLSMTLLKLLGRPSAIHIAVLSFHLLSCWTLYQLSKRNVVATLLFGCHPLASEVLGWASALPDAVASCFGLLALLSLQREKRWGFILFSFLGLLAKESAILPILMGVIFFARYRTLFCGILLSYALLRIRATQQSPEMELFSAIEAVQSYLWLLSSIIIPYPLTAVRELHVTPTWTLPIGVIVWISSLYIAVKGEKIQRIGFGILCLSPLIALPTILEANLAAERYAYLSLAGLALIASPWKLSLVRTVPILLMISFPLHLSRSSAWQSDQHLFRSATEATPTSSYAWHFLGHVYLRDQSPKQAAIAFENAIQHGHPYPNDHTLLLIALVQSEQYIRALQLAESGPKENLTAEHIAWWARAAGEVGNVKRSQALFQMLVQPDGSYDGPAWVKDYVHSKGDRP